MAELAALAELSHGLERVALALAEAHVETRFIVHELASAAAGQREALAIALSYLFRHQERGCYEDANALSGAIDAVTRALRQKT